MSEAIKPLKLLIFGSCVTRDVLNYDTSKKINLIGYFARSSLASALSPILVPDAYTKNLESPFQRRIVSFDLEKAFQQHLDEFDFDILVIDLIDERFPLYMLENGGICTVSTELISAGFQTTASVGRVITSGSDEFFRLWERGWCCLVAALQRTGRMSRLRINKVRWSLRTSEGGDSFLSHSLEEIKKANHFLERLYERISLDISNEQFLTFDKELFIASHIHRWGLSPFHYIDAYYQAALKAIIRSAKTFPHLHVQEIRPGNPVTPITEASECTPASVDSSEISMAYRASSSFLADYSTWQCAIHEINSLDDFLKKTEFENGIQRIHCGATTLDLLIQGMHRRGNNEFQHCLVGLSGAISNRAGSRPPFFSGRGIATELKLPLIAISDPSLALDETLPLAWYAGNNGERRLLDVLARIIEKIMSCHNLSPLLFGGSGGGYAALALSHLLPCKSIAIVWNPQTSIGEYGPNHVLQYLKTAFPELICDVKQAEMLKGQEQKAQIANLLERAGILHSLWGIARPPHAKVLYLQNRYDWHVNAHAKPYLEHSSWQRLGPTSFSQGKDLALHIGNWGVGHAAPSKDVIVQALTQLTQGKSIAEIATQLSNSREKDEYCHWFATDFVDPGWTPNFSCVRNTTTLRIKVDAFGLPSLEGLEYAIYLLKGNERKATIWYQKNPEFIIPLDGLDINTARVFVRDIWANVRIAQKPLPSEDTN